jgi:hypothetical protein
MSGSTATNVVHHDAAAIVTRDKQAQAVGVASNGELRHMNGWRLHMHVELRHI